MPKLTVLIHTYNDAETIGPLIETLKFCNDILVIDDNSEDETQRIARSRGARIKKTVPGVTTGAYAMDAYHDWILVVRPNEMPSRELCLALDEWRRIKCDEQSGYLIEVRDGDVSAKSQMRLVNRQRINWTGELPPTNTAAPHMPGELVRAAVEKAA